MTVANTSQARKRARQAEKSRQQNAAKRSMMRTYLKGVLRKIAAGDKEGAETAYKQMVPIVDRMANRGLIHKNKAGRHKSRLNSRIRGMS